MPQTFEYSVEGTSSKMCVSWYQIRLSLFSLSFSQLGAPTSLLTQKCQFLSFGWKKVFFANFKIKKNVISKIFVGNTPLGFPVKETLNVILISSVVLPTHPAKICIYGNLHHVALKLFCWVYYYHSSWTNNWPDPSHRSTVNKSLWFFSP